MRTMLLAAAAAVLTAAAPAAAAPIVGIYNTGVDNNGNVLAVGSAEQHYTLPGARAAGATPFVYANGAYANTTPGDAAYIAVQADGGYPGKQNPAMNDYALVFDLTGFDAATARITGQFAADNAAEIFLNNVSTGFFSSGFNSFTSFDITTGFVAGANSLTFRVTDFGKPSALVVDRVESSVQPSAAAVPELATWGMMIAGFGLIGAAARRRTVTVRYA